MTRCSFSLSSNETPNVQNRFLTRVASEEAASCQNHKITSHHSDLSHLIILGNNAAQDSLSTDTSILDRVALRLASVWNLIPHAAVRQGKSLRHQDMQSR